MPTNQHGPYFLRETSGVVDSPDKKFDNVPAPSAPQPSHQVRPAKQYIAHPYPLKRRDKSIPESYKVSIILPTFRREHTIKHAVDSIVAQTYKNWQLIIVDNEADHKPYKFQDKRIEYYNHSDTASAAFARNKGIEYIKGDLVCFFDDDDEMHPQYLERMVEPFHDQKVFMTHCLVRFLDTGSMNGGYCTPSSMVRVSSITPTWDCTYSGHDQLYWQTIFGNRENFIIHLEEVLVFCNTSTKGGLREGHL